MAADEGQRKLAAILAADVVGYSRLMADDERATVAALKEARAVFKDRIEAHGGRLIDTAGDSVLAEFRSVVEAVQCAVEVQEQLTEDIEAVPEHRRMYFRIGVNLGDVIEEADGTIYGDGVNIAARLESLAERGGIMVSESAHMQVEDKLEFALADAGAHEVKNIPKPVRAYRVLLDGSEGERRGKPGNFTKASRRRTKLVAGLVAGLAVLVGLAVWGITIRVEAPQMVMADGTPTDDPVLAMPQGPSVAVLPFTNLGGDTDQHFFSEGLTEDIVTALSKFSELRVISRNLAARYQNTEIDVREIGATLDADHVLMGSVRRADAALRVTAQLLDARNGAHVWSQQFDRDLSASAVFEVQDTITIEVATAIAGYGGAIARQILGNSAGERTEDLAAYECVLLVYVVYDSAFGLENFNKARNCLEGAVARDPTYADALSALSYLYGDAYSMGIARGLEGIDPIQRSFELASTAVRLNPNNAAAHRALALAHFYRQEMTDFVDHSERALVLNPHGPTTLGQLGSYLVMTGERTRGAALVQKAYALNPDLPDWYNLSLALERYFVGDFEEALAFANASKDPNNYIIPWQRIVYLAELGRLDEAKPEFEKLESLYPGFSISTARDENTYWGWPSRDIDIWVSSMRKAGFPEAPSGPSRPVIAVLPFDNMSGDPEQEYFAQGLAADISTAFTHFDLRVVASETAAAAVETPGDLSKVVSGLGADYLVTGSVRRTRETLRLAVQLIEGVDGSQIWGQTFDVDLEVASVFELMDEVTQLITAQIASGFGAINMERITSLNDPVPGSMSSYDCYLRAVAYQMILSPEDNRAARTCLEKALESDPTYSNGWAQLSNLYTDDLLMGFNFVENAADRALEAASRSVQLSPKNQLAYAALAHAHAANGDRESYVNAAFKAADLNPNDGTSLAELGAELIWAGEYEKGKALIDRGIYLNSHHFPWINLGLADYLHHQGEFDEALTYTEKCLAEDPDNPGGLIIHISLLGRLGRGGEAVGSIERLETIWPDIAQNVGGFLAGYFFSNEPKIGEYLDGMRDAGFTASDRVN